MLEKLQPLPTIETPRLRLRAVAGDDAQALFRVAGDEPVSEFLAWQPHRSLEETTAFIAAILAGYERGGCFRFGIALKESDQLIGLLNLKPVFSQDRINLGYWLGRHHWNMGYATEAVKAAITFSFDVLQANRVEAEHFIENPASGRVMEKAGLRYEGLLKQYILGKDRKYHDCKLYAVTKDAWQVG